MAAEVVERVEGSVVPVQQDLPSVGLLSRGTVEGLTVTCPLHGSQYCLADGSVRRGPSHQPQPVIRTRVRNGWIEVRGNQPAPRRAAKGRK